VSSTAKIFHGWLVLCYLLLLQVKFPSPVEQNSPMNLARTRTALLAIQRSEHRALRIWRNRNESDVREMVEAGLIRASVSNGSPGSLTSASAITEAGRQFLRLFPAGYRFCDAGLAPGA
jgi:hypothetical protein